MGSMQHLTPVAMFAAMTRAVREETMADDIRQAAYSHLESLSMCIHQDRFGRELDGFHELAERHADLHVVVLPFMAQLRRLAAGGAPGAAAGSAIG